MPRLTRSGSAALKRPLDSLGFVKQKKARTTSIKAKELSEKLVECTRTRLRRLKASLRTVPPQKEFLLCREREQRVVEKFLIERLVSRKGGSLYCVGCPGTGKSLTLKTVMDRIKTLRSRHKFPAYVVAKLNALAVSAPAAIYSLLLEQLTDSQPKSAEDSRRKLDRSFRSRSSMHIVVIDEIDGLLNRKQDVLYQLFEWASRENSSLLLIGIANALELTNRFLPRLVANNCVPEMLSFRPYTYVDLKSIMRERLEQCGAADSFDDHAIELLARKVAGSTGDARKLLELSRKALEKAMGTSVGFSKDPKVVVGLKHASGALRTFFDSPHVATIQSLPQHQQIVLCVASLLLHGSKKATTVGEFHMYYSKMSRRLLLPSVDASDFADIISALCSQGIVETKTARASKNRIISMRVQRQDIEFALQDNNFISSILQSRDD